jgi:hypothetical protein
MKDAELLGDNLQRIVETRYWVQSNVLFPEVGDVIVHPLRKLLQDAENALVIALHAMGETERVAVIMKRLKPAPRTPVT